MVGHFELISLIIWLKLEAFLIEQGRKGYEVCPVIAVGRKIHTDLFGLGLDCLIL